MGKAWILVAAEALFVAGFLLLGSYGPSSPNRDGYLRIPIGSNPPTLDPVQTLDTIANAIGARIFDTLVRHDRRLDIVPGLAERWELSADGRTYTFYLRKGVMFDRIGRAVTAADVKYSLERLLDPAVSRQDWLLRGLVLGAAELWEARKAAPETTAGCRGIEVAGERIVRIRLVRPHAPFIRHLAMVSAAVVPREEIERLGEQFARHPVGTGAFRLVEWVHDSHVQLEARTDHWAGRPKIRGILYRVVSERQVMYQEYRAGNFDICPVPLGMLEGIRSSPQGADLHSWTNLSTFYLAVTQNWEEAYAVDAGGNEHGVKGLTRADLARRGWTRKTRLHPYRPYGASRKLRQALNYAIDREYLCEVILEEQAVPARGVLPPGMPGYNPDLSGYAFDPERARRLLAEAGFPGGAAGGLPRVQLYYNANPMNKLLVERLQIDLKAVGIEVELRSLEWTSYLEKVRGARPPPLFRLGWVADFPDPENFLYVLFHGKNAGDTNRARYQNPEADRLLDAARAAADPAERIGLFRRVEERIVEDAPWVFIYHGRSNLLVKPYVIGLRETTTGLDTGTDLPQVDFLNLEIR